MDIHKRLNGSRFLLVGLAIYWTAVAVVGFVPSYLDSAAGKFPIDAVVHVHGVLMGSWLGLFICQTWLAATGRLARHRSLGLAGMWLAAAIWISMWVMTIHGLHRGKFPQDEFLIDVLLPQLAMIVLFPVFIVWGYQARRRSDVHRRLMILATLVLLQASVDRMFWLPSLALPGFWDHAFRLYVIVLAPLFLFDLLSIRRLHRTTLLGSGLILTAHLIISLLWATSGWHAFAHLVASPIM